MDRERLSQATVSQEIAFTFVEKGILSFDQVNVALHEHRRTGISFEDCLLALNFISESALVEALSLASGREAIALSQILFDPSLKEYISRETAEKYSLIPLSLENGVLRIAISDIYNLQALESLRKELKTLHTILPCIAPLSDILDAIDRYYGYEGSIPGILREIENTNVSAFGENGKDNPTIRLVNAILMDAIKLRASDIHFEPEGAFMRLRYRIDGLLSQICTFHSSYWPAMCVRLKVLGEMNIAESRRPQSGRMTYFVGPREIDLRLSSHPTVHGENVVVRILDKSRSLLNLEKLGYSPSAISSIKQALQKPEGIFIITGPTGSGKTTSLYALLNHISTHTLNIMTLEEPVEYKLPLIRQSDIRELGGMDFAEGVRSILRQDPDIILIGEIRDTSTAHMALRASMTGHQVFSTLHTTDALGALYRLSELGLSRGMLIGNLVAVIAQRLLRKLCPHCKKKRPMTSAEARALRSKKQSILFSPQGCPECRGSGYTGRFASAEVLRFDATMNELLATNSPRLSLHNRAVATGYIPLQEDIRCRVLQGDTSFEEAVRIIDLQEEI